jgi:hypothetical protein
MALKADEIETAETSQVRKAGLPPLLISQIAARFSSGLVVAPTFSAETFACMKSIR